MKITFLGHAGLYVETRHGSILCDPWFNSAFFASWFPFPSNEELDRQAFGNPDYLYISHVHEDHLDRAFLREHVSKDATVILPDHPLPLVRRELEALGFTRFIQTRTNMPLDRDGLRLMTLATVHPEDGPLGDSALAVDDGEVRMFDQNDARPLDFDGLQAFGHVHAHFVQFSGAIWYPMRYRFPPQMKTALGRKKRELQMGRSLRYSRQVDPDWVIPTAGPPCFLDDEFFEFNDFGDDPANVFPDQTVYLDYMRSNGAENGRLMIPGSVAYLEPEGLEIEHRTDPETIFGDKRAYLEAYRERKRPVIEAEKASWPRGEVDILPALQEWFEPVVELADRTAAAINGRVLLDCGSDQVVLDFWRRRVYAWEGDPCEYTFIFDQRLVEQLIKTHEENWVDTLFLSCRFEAARKGAYNEYVYSFLKCLSAERMAYAEGCYAEQVSEKEFFECAGYLVQRRCPHMKGDLTRFGQVKDGILTCTLHGWQFELATGRCLTSDDRRLFSEPLEDAPEALPELEPVPEAPAIAFAATRGLARIASVGRRASALFLTAVGVMAAYVIDSSFVQPRPGTTGGDHLVSGLVPLALLAVAAAAYPRAQARARASLALLVGSLAVVAGTAEALYDVLTASLSVDDYSGLLALLAGILLVAMGSTQLDLRAVEARREH